LTDNNAVRLNPMPSGTTVTVTSDDTTKLTVGPVGGQPVINTLNPTGIAFTYSLIGDPTVVTLTGGATMNVTTPGPLFLNGTRGGATTTTFHLTVKSDASASPCTSGT
jgi:hypothetical protein